MEVSILQHAKDTSPKAVGISEIVDLIRGDQWPPGYQPVLLVQGTFDGGTRQQNLTRLSGLSAAAFCHVEGSSLAELREEARADPHTLLLYTTGDSLIVIYPYELDVGYEVYLQRQFYQKAFLFGNDYYERLLGVQSVRKGKDAGKRCPLGHDAEAYYNPQAEPFLSWEIKEGCRRQTSQPKSTEGLRERKPNYREVYMSLDEIEQWMKKHIQLRRNVITMRKEYRWLEDGYCDDDKPWENFDDIVYNDVWRQLEKVKPTKDEELALTQYGLISCEELDTMTTREMNKMKRAITLSYVNVRPPFGRYTVHRPHIASFCGTGNNEKFLTTSVTTASR